MVTKLKNAGYEDQAICKMTGHQNLQSLASYQKTSNKDLRGMPNALASTSSSSEDKCRSSESCAAQPFAEEHASTLPKHFSAKNSVFHNIVIDVGISEPLAKRVCKGYE